MILMLFEVVLGLAEDAFKFKFIQSGALKPTQLRVIHWLSSTSCRTVIFLLFPVFETVVTKNDLTLHALSRGLCWLLTNTADKILIERLADRVFFTRSIANDNSSSSHLLNDIFEITKLNSLFSGGLLLPLSLSRKSLHLGLIRIII